MTNPDRHLIVDGSNIATEGRTLPSLKQLDEAVRSICDEQEFTAVIVIVDATFAHRINQAEREEFEAAVLAGEVVTPPAGAIGRGDAFILQVADKVDGVVLSNDSFQEFHGEHAWLFDEGRLIGGKPIDVVGWVFVERAPVRGPTSRRAIKDASSSSSSSSSRRSNTRPSSRSSKPAAKPSSAAKPAAPAENRRSTKSLEEKTTDGDQTGRPVDELNDARSFMRFVSQYSIGEEVQGTVERYSSHGCYLRAASARCYLPSREMGDPPPKRARDVVARGQEILVRVQSLDPKRRGINVTLVSTSVPGTAEPTDSNPATEQSSEDANNSADRPVGDSDDTSGSSSDAKSETPRRVSKAKATVVKASGGADKLGTTQKTPSKKTAVKKRLAKATPTKRATAKKAPAKKAAAKKAAKKTTAKKATTKKSTVKKAAAKKARAKKTTTKKAVAKKAVAKKTTAKKAVAKKATAKKARARKAPAKEATAAK